MHDLLIKGGTVVDGTGDPGRTADVAITDGIVTEVGRVNELARETVDADGALVTPGFVDVHTHVGVSRGSQVTCPSKCVCTPTAHSSRPASSTCGTTGLSG